MRFKKLIVFALIVSLITVAGFSLAQDFTQSTNEIPPCTDDELVRIARVLRFGVRDFADFLNDYVREDREALERADAITSLHVAYWNGVDLAPKCAETYTRLYEFGRVVDDFTAAFSMSAALRLANATGEDEIVENFLDRIDAVLEDAGDILADNFPDLVDELA